ncbi:hypothetical protein VTI74DRAFT_2518 [Chaetomium olivicolor]
MASSRSASSSRRTKSTKSTEATDVSSNAKWTSAGSPDVTLRQALHDGAIGARAIYALSNYGAEEPPFDGNCQGASPGSDGLTLE